MEDKKKLLMYQMKQLFLFADKDCSGTISWDEFREVLDNPKMIDFLKAIDLDSDEAADLFTLMDIEGTGEIRHDDFVAGCLQVHGPAKSIDLATFMREYERQTKYSIMHAQLMEDSMYVIIEDIRRRAELDRDDIAFARSTKISEELQHKGDSTQKAEPFFRNVRVPDRFSGERSQASN